MEPNFEQIKAEILRRAKEAKACREQYGRAYNSKTVAELMTVVKDNFDWCFGLEVIDCVLIEKYREDFAANGIYSNVSVVSGYLLCDSATVRACDSATVKAYGSATVKAYGRATVEACDSAYCSSFFAIECKLSDNAIYRVRSTNTVYYASDDIKFVKQ